MSKLLHRGDDASSEGLLSAAPDVHAAWHGEWRQQAAFTYDSLAVPVTVVSPAEKMRSALRISAATARVTAVVLYCLIAVPLILIFVISLVGSMFSWP
jgi:hypothetical protein